MTGRRRVPRDTSSSQVAGNVDRRQMESLPLQGRNWMELSKLVKGITANDVTNTPGVSADDMFQLNLDGQQITQKVFNGGSVLLSGHRHPRNERKLVAEARRTHLNGARLEGQSEVGQKARRPMLYSNSVPR